MMEETGNDWAAWSKHVLYELERLNAEDGKIREECKAEIKLLHIAPCPAIAKVEKESGSMKAMIANLDDRSKETRRNFYILIGLMLTAIGLLLGVLKNIGG